MNSAVIPEGLVVVIPSFNAAFTIGDLIDRVENIVCREKILVVDDHSLDDTAAIAEAKGVSVIRHEKNLGYGGSQKTAIRWAIAEGSTMVAMIHGDAQYPPEMIPAGAISMDVSEIDLLLGNRIRSREECLSARMPLLKYFANRGLTVLQNIMTGQNLGEWHSGWRMYRTQTAQKLPIDCYSDGFEFDTQFILGVVGHGGVIGDVPVKPNYFKEASSISILRSSRYAIHAICCIAFWRIRKILRLRSKFDCQPY